MLHRQLLDARKTVAIEVPRKCGESASNLVLGPGDRVVIVVDEDDFYDLTQRNVEAIIVEVTTLDRTRHLELDSDLQKPRVVRTAR